MRVQVGELVCSRMMKKRSDHFQAFKQFAKEIGAPDVITCDAAKEQTPHDVK